MTVEDTAEDLASDLGVDKEEVKRDLENLLEYSVPMDEAVQSLRRKYGGGSETGGPPEPASIESITTDDAAVTVTGRVLTKGKRSIRYQGEDRVIHEGEIADETGRISYTAWTEIPFEAGGTVTIANAGVREWSGRPELNIGEGATVTMEPEALEVPYSVGGESSLVELAPGDRGVTVEAVVVEVEEKTIDGRDGET
ncbi:MAG: replication factor A, partial [Halobacteriales archaeon]|nr:replication factor A [Halobacteriales archaeon]